MSKIPKKYYQERIKENEDRIDLLTKNLLKDSEQNNPPKLNHKTVNEFIESLKASNVFLKTKLI